MKKLFVSAILLLAFLLSFVFVSFAEEQPLDIKWVEGPNTVSMDNISKLDLSSEYLFADKESTVKIMESIGNPKTGTEIGSVFSKNQNENWFVIFEYYETGHIKDNDKDKIDADDLLKSIKKGNEEANKERKKMGMQPLNVVGWLEEPNYNEQFHSLVWCTLAESAKGYSANYESRLLCREGYVAATLVCSDKDLEATKPHLKKIIDKYSFVEGKRYEDYVEGKDKLSDLGLAALIVGGSAIAVKKGFLVVLLVFLKKGGIVLFVPIVAFFRRLFGRKKPRHVMNTEGEQNGENSDKNDSMTQNVESETLEEIASADSEKEQNQ
jgi:uncharacterized membrane-anchored protein